MREREGGERSRREEEREGETGTGIPYGTENHVYRGVRGCWLSCGYSGVARVQGACGKVIGR